jgi:hypothetical protein
MSSVYKVGGKEHVEGECAGAAKGHAQADIFVVGAVDPEAQCAQVSQVEIAAHTSWTTGGFALITPGTP